MAVAVSAPAEGDGDFDDGPDAVAERILLGLILLSDDTITERASTVFLILSPEDFCIPKHAILFAALKALRDEKQPIDIVTLSHELKRREVLPQAGGLGYLMRLVDTVPEPIVADMNRQDATTVVAASVASLAHTIRQNADARRAQNPDADSQ